MRHIVPVAFGWSPDCLGEQELRELVAAHVASAGAALPSPDGIRVILDVRGRRCPYPVSELRRHMALAKPGERVVLLSDDPVARLDVEHAVRQAGDHLRHRITMVDFEAYLVERSRDGT